MSWFEWVDDSIDSVTDWGEKVYESAGDQVDNVKEYFIGDDEKVSDEVDGVPGTNAATQDRQSGVTPSPVNWGMIGVLVTAAGVLVKVLK